MLDPLDDIKGRARHGYVVVAGLVIFQALRTRIEIREPELASRSAEERMLLVDWLERGEGDIGETDGRDHDRKAAARADVEDSGDTTEMRNDVQAIDEVLGDLLAVRCCREVDAAIPLIEEGNKS